MPRYYFHVVNGSLMPDWDGTELPGIEEARAEAVSVAGAMLKELGEQFWNHGAKWQMHVTDEQGHLLFSLRFEADLSAGEDKYYPIVPSTDAP